MRRACFKIRAMLYVLLGILIISCMVGCGGLKKKSSGYAWSKVFNGEGLSLVNASILDEDDIWAVKYDAINYDNGIFYDDGDTWVMQYASDEEMLWDIIVLDLYHVWAVGGKLEEGKPIGYVYYYNGISWEKQYEKRASKGLANIFALDNNHVWAAGNIILFFDGNTWVDQYDPQEMVRGIFALDQHNVWAGSQSGKIYYFNGSSWQEQQSLYGPDERVSISSGEIFAVDSNHVWAALFDYESERGKIFFFNGTSWKEQVETPHDIVVTSMYALDENHVWAAGGSDFKRPCPVLFYDGKAWHIQEEFDESLVGVRAIDENKVMVVGESGSLYLGKKE